MPTNEPLPLKKKKKEVNIMELTTEVQRQN